MDEREVIAGLDEEEQKRLERIAKLDANQKRKKVIFGAVTVALIAMFIAGTVFGAKYIRSNEGTQPLPAAGAVEQHPAHAHRVPVAVQVAQDEMADRAGAVKGRERVEIVRLGAVAVVREVFVVDGARLDRVFAEAVAAPPAEHGLVPDPGDDGVGVAGLVGTQPEHGITSFLFLQDTL